MITFAVFSKLGWVLLEGRANENDRSVRLKKTPETTQTFVNLAPATYYSKLEVRHYKSEITQTTAIVQKCCDTPGIILMSN